MQFHSHARHCILLVSKPFEVFHQLSNLAALRSVVRARTYNLPCEASPFRARRWSLDLRYAVSLIGVDGDESSWQQFDDYHRIALKRLQASDADFVVMASNTPHHRYSAIVSGVDIPVLNLFEAVAQHCQAEGHREVLILGTALTMRSQVLRDAFTAKGINASAPAGRNHREAVLALIATLQRGDSEGAARSIAALAREATGCHFTAEAAPSLPLNRCQRT